MRENFILKFLEIQYCPDYHIFRVNFKKNFLRVYIKTHTLKWTLQKIYLKNIFNARYYHVS